MPGSAMAASDGWPRASSIRWRPCSSRRWATGCATSTACSGNRSTAAGSASIRTAGCAGRIRGKSRGAAEAVEIRLGCTFEIHQGNLEIVANRPSTLIGIPYDRPVIGFGGKTINSLRLWSAAATDSFDFQEFSSGDFVGALVGSIAAQTLTRVLYPDDSTEMGQGLRFAQEYFLLA